MSEIKSGRCSLYGAEHLKCNCMVKLGFKGLSSQVTGCLSEVAAGMNDVQPLCVTVVAHNFLQPG